MLNFSAIRAAAPHTSRSRKLRLFHVEHTFCSQSNSVLNFSAFPQAFLNFKFPGGGGSLPEYLTSLQSEPPPPYFPKPKTPIVPRGTHNLFIIQLCPELLCLSASFPEFQVFSGGGGSFPEYLTSLQSEPPPHTSRSRKLRLFHVEHTICSQFNSVLNFSAFPQAFLNFKFPGGGGSFSCYLTSLQSEPPPPYFPKLKTPISHIFSLQFLQ